MDIKPHAVLHKISCHNYCTSRFVPIVEGNMKSLSYLLLLALISIAVTKERKFS